MTEGIIVEGHAYVTESEENMKNKFKSMFMMVAFVAVLSAAIPVFAARSTDFKQTNGSNRITGNASIRKSCFQYDINYNVFVRGVDGIYGKFQLQGPDSVYLVNKTVYKNQDLVQRSAYTGASTMLVKARINGASTYVSNYISY